MKSVFYILNCVVGDDQLPSPGIGYVFEGLTLRDNLDRLLHLSRSINVEMLPGAQTPYEQGKRA
jgi:hypothetical protein